jgi:hypothetical protein
MLSIKLFALREHFDFYEQTVMEAMKITKHQMKIEYENTSYPTVTALPRC